MSRRARRARQHRRDWLRGYRIGISDMGFGTYDEWVDAKNPVAWRAWNEGAIWAIDLSRRKLPT